MCRMGWRATPKISTFWSSTADVCVWEGMLVFMTSDWEYGISTSHIMFLDFCSLNNECYWCVRPILSVLIGVICATSTCCLQLPPQIDFYRHQVNEHAPKLVTTCCRCRLSIALTGVPEGGKAPIKVLRSFQLLHRRNCLQQFGSWSVKMGGITKQAPLSGR